MTIFPRRLSTMERVGLMAYKEHSMENIADCWKEDMAVWPREGHSPTRKLQIGNSRGPADWYKRWRMAKICSFHDALRDHPRHI
jgi:hypothetical protein